MLPKQTEYKVGMYMRLSKDDERSGESLSIENQRKILTEYITQQGWTLYDEYVDDGISGTTFERPGVQRLLDDAKTGRINLILCKDLSRFGRNYIQVGQYTDYIFPMYNIRFIALTDNVDTANSASSGMDMMPIMNVFNEWHSANTSKKIRAVVESGAKSGKYRTTFASYGYRIKAACGQLVSEYNRQGKKTANRTVNGTENSNGSVRKSSFTGRASSKRHPFAKHKNVGKKRKHE